MVVSARDLLAPEARREAYSSLAASGAWSPSAAVELADVITGKPPAREHAAQIVVLELVGLAAWDTAVLSWAYHWAVAHDVGTEYQLSAR